MATSTRTRRKASDTPAAPAADRPADAAADTPPPATTAPTPAAPARKAAARKRAAVAAAPAPADATPVAQAAPTPAATPAAAAKPARKTAARKAAVKAPEAVAAPDAPAPATVDETPAAKPATKAAAKRTGSEAAGKKVAAKKVAAKKAAAKKVAPKKTARPVAPQAAAAEPAPEPTADLLAIAVAETPLAPPSAPEAVPVTEVAATAPTTDTIAPTTDTIAPDSEADVAELTEVANTPADEDAPAEAADATAEAPSRSRRNRNRRRRGARAADPQAQATAEAVLAVLAAPAPDTVAVDLPAADSSADSAEARATDASATAADDTAPASAPDPEPAPPPTGPAHSRIACLPGDAVRIAWQPGHACPPALRQAAQRRVDADGLLSPEDDAALPLLLRLAQEGGHTLQVDPDVWPLLAAHRDARHRLSALEAAYPDGPASPALQRLLRVPLPLFQAEGALFAVIAGRALIADERGLGKGVQAIAAARLWQRHFGVQRVLVLCAPAQRAAWQRAWQRLAGGDDTQVIDGGHHQRPAQWAATAGVRILAPEALQTDAAHLAHWAADLVIVDEPQQLGLQAADWAALQDVPQALVLSGAPLADLPALTDSLVAWLDTARLGPLAALRELQAASRGERTLDEADVERLSASLSRLMLQRQRDDVADQLPPVVHSERLLPLAPGQRAVHDRHAAVARRLLAGWQASGWCSDTDQWRLAQALHGMQQACHRADPADPASALAEATVQALAGTLAELAQLGTGSGADGADNTDGAPQVAVLCASAADQAQLAARLAEFTGGSRPVHLLAPGDHLPGGVDVVLQAGVPWRVRRQAGGPRGEAPAGQQWIHLVAQDGIDGGLFDTLAARIDAPRGPGDGGARGYLQGEALQQWLALLQAALAATPVAAG